MPGFDIDFSVLAHETPCHRCHRVVDEPADPRESAALLIASPVAPPLTVVLCGACMVDLLSFLEPDGMDDPETVAEFDQILARQRNWREKHYADAFNLPDRSEE